MNETKQQESVSRRDFLKASGLSALALGAGSGLAAAVQAGSTGAARGGGQPQAGPYNILFVLLDQERFFRPGELPRGFSLPAHERLARQDRKSVV